MDKVRVRKLPKVSAPIPPGGGRIRTPAGELAQVVNGTPYRFLAYIEFLPDAAKPRGNHYHHRKTEIMYVIRGRLQATYQDLDTDERLSVELEAGDLVTIDPRCAHVYRAVEHTHAIEIAEHEYDPEDTQPHPVTT